MNQVTDTEKFLFDIQGYLILRGAIDGDLIDALDFAVVQNEAFDHDESWADGLPIVTAQHFIKDNNIEHQVRLNGLPRLDPIFDQLIGHPSILPYLKEFMGDPQLVNTWSISKYEGRAATGWHHGLPIEEYTVRNGLIRSPMLNVVTMLTPNHPGDGCFTVIPGSHKKNFNLNPQWMWDNLGYCVKVSVEIEINSEYLIGKRTMKLSEERWVSGLNHRFAKPAKGVTPSEGSNPSLSANR